MYIQFKNENINFEGLSAARVVTVTASWFSRQKRPEVFDLKTSQAGKCRFFKFRYKHFTRGNKKAINTWKLLHKVT